MYKRQIVLLALLAMAVIYIGTACECQQPIIQSMTPNSGPGGTIVEVVYTKGGVSGTIQYQGSGVPTGTASNLGLGKTLFFTIPYDATAGNKTVAVASGGKTSATVNFNVTGPTAVPTPTIDGFEMANGKCEEITIFGTNFSTLSKVYIAGTEVDHYSGASLPFRQLPHNMVDNVIICTHGSALTPGSAYNIQVKNPGGVNSALFNITVPDRFARMEYDAIVGYDPPEYYIWRNNTVNTMRKTYSGCGWIIDLIHDDVEVVDPMTGVDFTAADLYSFWQANADHRLTDTCYMHGAFLSTMDLGAMGIMFMHTGRVPTLPNANRREGFALFFDAFAANQRNERYLRSTIHESGHGFNLYHGDATVGTTIMNQTGAIGANWNYNYSAISCTHLNTHAINAVCPGGDAWGARSCNALH